MSQLLGAFFFFFNDTATTEIYTLSLHDALPICSMTAVWKRPLSRTPRMLSRHSPQSRACASANCSDTLAASVAEKPTARSEEHTSELQSRQYLVCRLLLEKKKKKLRHCTQQTSY